MTIIMAEATVLQSAAGNINAVLRLARFTGDMNLRNVTYFMESSQMQRPLDMYLRNFMIARNKLKNGENVHDQIIKRDFSYQICCFKI